MDEGERTEYLENAEQTPRNCTFIPKRAEEQVRSLYRPVENTWRTGGVSGIVSEVEDRQPGPREECMVLRKEREKGCCSGNRSLGGGLEER